MNKNDKALNAESTAQLARLRAALVQGENSGPSTPFDFDAFIKTKRRLANFPREPTT